ncbi:MAG: protein-(glutamine-N5) methyltransferase, release factor-specific [Chloroflexi bacterium RBG_16_50_11]|nr:MAG: protein-(glutamine-N5) methyltransferase, release factor-specific [Chloroflexi bacterium RBG_16_50_11]
MAQVRQILVDNHIEDASLEGEILLRHVLGIGRARLFTDLDYDVCPSKIKTLLKLVQRRVNGEPSAYITGSREFYGLDFKVNRHVLIPRPETELLVEKAIDFCRQSSCSKIADIGTGCGAIAISLAVNLPSAWICATDISARALKVAKENCVKHGVADRVTLLPGDLLEPLPGPVEMIVANLPYVRESDITSGGALSFEPRMALNGGERGLDKIKLLCRQAAEKLIGNGSLLLEIGQGQAEEVKTILHKYFPAALIKVENDLAGIERVVSLRLT